MAQPDFNALRASMGNTANGFRNAAAEMDNASTEIDKIQNMAAANIVRQLAQMQEQMQAQLEQMQAQLNQVEQNILRQLSRSENNNFARLFNSRVADETHRLEPLYDMNNELIEDFPQTSADINELNAAGVDALLRALDCRLTVEQKLKKRGSALGS